MFGEDAVETLHKKVNELRRRFSGIKNMLVYLRTVHDEMNLEFEMACKEAGEKQQACKDAGEKQQ